MNEMGFLTEDFLMTFAGQVVFVTLFTEAIKLYVNKLDPKVISLILSVLISLVSQLVFKQDFSVDGILLSLFNSVVVLLSSIGGYEVAVKKIQNKIEANILDTTESEYTINNEENK